MIDEKIKESIGPCGLCCETCFAHVEGDIRKYSMKLKEKLGNFHINAKRFETILDNPIFKKYADFKEMLNYFASGNCKGCRNEQCKLFKDCGVLGATKKNRLIFVIYVKSFLVIKLILIRGFIKDGWQ